MSRLTALILLLSLSTTIHADWVLDEDSSSLGFSSVKNGSIVEPHVFTSLSGQVSTDGTATVTVALDSVDTMIPIRDERMRDMLFETDQYPQATFEATVPLSDFEDLAPGESRGYELDGTLSLHGNAVDKTLQVRVVGSGAGRTAVNSVRPMMISASDFELTAGLEQLREIAGLEAITPMVPVSFSLVFEREAEQ